MRLPKRNNYLLKSTIMRWDGEGVKNQRIKLMTMASSIVTTQSNWIWNFYLSRIQRHLIRTKQIVCKLWIIEVVRITPRDFNCSSTQARDFQCSRETLRDLCWSITTKWDFWCSRFHLVMRAWMIGVRICMIYKLWWGEIKLNKILQNNILSLMFSKRITPFKTNIKCVGLPLWSTRSILVSCGVVISFTRLLFFWV